MFGIGCPGRHALPLTPPQKGTDCHARSNPARAGSFKEHEPSIGAEPGDDLDGSTAVKRRFGEGPSLVLSC
jgi:hypothetical protein